MSLSSVITALTDLQCHLHQFPRARTVTREILTDIHERFSSLLNPSFPDYNPMPAAACLVDPSLAAVLFTPEARMLIEPAKLFLTQEVWNGHLLFTLLQ
jgi:hypothetical protein